MKKILTITLIILSFSAFGQTKFSLITKDSVTWYDSPSTQITSLITGELLEKYQRCGSGITVISFIYKDSEGNIYLQEKIEISDAEMDQLYLLVKDGLPSADVVGYSTYEWRLYYEGFRFKMSGKLGIPIDRIELVE